MLNLLADWPRRAPSQSNVDLALGLGLWRRSGDRIGIARFSSRPGAQSSLCAHGTPSPSRLPRRQSLDSVEANWDTLSTLRGAAPSASFDLRYSRARPLHAADLRSATVSSKCLGDSPPQVDFAKPFAQAERPKPVTSQLRTTPELSFRSLFWFPPALSQLGPLLSFSFSFSFSFPFTRFTLPREENRMLRMRKTDHDRRWVVEEIELGDVTQPLQHQPQYQYQNVDADVESEPTSDPSVPSASTPGRHTEFRVDGLVAVTTALKVGGGVTLAFFLVGGPLLCCLLVLALFYLLVAYSTKAERQQEVDDWSRMERAFTGTGTGADATAGSASVGVLAFVSGQCTRLFQRMAALKQSVVNYSLTVSIAESQAMMDLDEIVHGRNRNRPRRRRSSLLPCVESECEGELEVDSAAVMENLWTEHRPAHEGKRKGDDLVRRSKPFELRPVHLDSLRAGRSHSLPMPPLLPLEEEAKRAAQSPPPRGSDAESEAEPEAEIEIEPVVPPQSRPQPRPLVHSEPQPEPERPTVRCVDAADSDSDFEEDTRVDEELVERPRPSLLASTSTAASKAMHSAAQAVHKFTSKLQIPVYLTRPLPRLVVHRAPTKLTTSQHVRRMLDEADKMETELNEILARNALFFQEFEDTRESLEIPRRSPDDDELSHNALSSGEEEGEFWYEDALGSEFLDDVPPYLRGQVQVQVAAA